MSEMEVLNLMSPIFTSVSEIWVISEQTLQGQRLTAGTRWSFLHPHSASTEYGFGHRPCCLLLLGNPQIIQCYASNRIQIGRWRCGLILANRQVLGTVGRSFGSQPLPPSAGCLSPNWANSHSVAQQSKLGGIPCASGSKMLFWNTLEKALSSRKLMMPQFIWMTHRSFNRCIIFCHAALVLTLSD